MKRKITIYTDGAARGNPGPAGWGAVIIFHDDELKIKNSKLKILEVGGREKHATNNQMELEAAIEALKNIKISRSNLYIPQGSPVEIITDSKYVVLGITEWIHNWMKKGWRTAGRKPVLNRELWEELFELNEEIKPKWSYVEGHGTDKYNNRADEIATSFADDVPVKLKHF
jgi:ribonuclease HI